MAPAVAATAMLVFWGSAALVAFAYAGYPLWLLILARIAPRPVARSPRLPTVTVVMAAHNAEDRVRDKLMNLLALDYPADKLDIVVACDGCSDRTAQVCGQVGDSRIRVLEFDHRRGKASCLADAVATASGEVLLMVDVRQRVEPRALRALVACLGDATVGVVGGQLRFEDPDTGFAESVGAYWRYETAIRAAESASGSVIGVSGALYALRRELFMALPAETVLDDVLVPMQAAARGVRVVLEPDAVAWDRASPSSATEQRRKVRTLAGNLQLVQMAPWLLDPRLNPLWFRFVCHKLLRLVVPWLLLAMLAMAIVLAVDLPLYRMILAAAVGAVVLVMASTWIPLLARPWPVRLLVAFVHMNLYAAQAAVAYTRRRSLHLW